MIKTCWHVGLLASILLALAGCGGHGNHDVGGSGSQPILFTTQPTVSNGCTVTIPATGNATFTSRTGIVIDSTTTPPEGPTTTDYADPFPVSSTAAAYTIPIKSAALGHTLKVLVYGQASGSPTYTILTTSAASSAVTQ